MNQSTYRPQFDDVARPLPMQMRHARFMTAPATDASAGAPAGSEGGTGDSGEAGGSDPSGGQENPTPTPADLAKKAQEAKDGDSGEQDSIWNDPQKARLEIERLRRENSKKRVDPKEAAQQAQSEVVQQIGKALGLVEDESVDPETLAKDVTQAREDARLTAVELAVYKSASKNQGNPDALLDSRQFLGKVKDLDPKDEDFQDQISNAVKAAVGENPRLRATQAVGSSSAEHPGGSGEGAKQYKTLDEAVSAHYG